MSDLYDPTRPIAMQEEPTFEEKWAEAEAELEAQEAALVSFYWKAAGRPWGQPEEAWLPTDLCRNPPKEWWED